MLELRRPPSILRCACPIIRPRLILVRTECNHGLNCECHSRLRCANSLVLGIMRYVRRGVEDLVDAVAAVCFYDRAFLALGMFFNDISWLAEGHAGLDDLNGFIEAGSCSFDNTDGVGVRRRFGADIVGLI